MRKIIISIVCVIIVLPLVLVASYDAWKTMRVEMIMDDLRGYIPNLMSYVTDHKKLLDDMVGIQSTLDKKIYIESYDGRICVFYDVGIHPHTKTLINDSTSINNEVKKVIETFVESYPEYELLLIRQDEVRIGYRYSENRDCFLFLTNTNHYNDRIIDNNNSNLYVERIDDTWYAVITHMPLG